MVRFIRAFILPFRYARLIAFYVSVALSHPIGVAVAAFLLWRSNSTPHGEDNGGFLVSLLGYIVLIAGPARVVRTMTRPPPQQAKPVLPQETKWPAPAQVALALPAPAEELAPSEAEMWAQLDPLLQRIAKLPVQ